METSNEAKQAAANWWIDGNSNVAAHMAYAEGYDDATAKLKEELEATRDVVIRLVKLAHQQRSSTTPEVDCNCVLRYGLQCANCATGDHDHCLQDPKCNKAGTTESIDQIALRCAEAIYVGCTLEEARVSIRDAIIYAISRQPQSKLLDEENYRELERLAVKKYGKERKL